MAVRANEGFSWLSQWGGHWRNVNRTLVNTRANSGLRLKLWHAVEVMGGHVFRLLAGRQFSQIASDEKHKVIEHILPYNSALERLINYCIFKPKFSSTLKTCTQFIPHIFQSAQKLHCITLHCITACGTWQICKQCGFFAYEIYLRIYPHFSCNVHPIRANFAWIGNWTILLSCSVHSEVVSALLKEICRQNWTVQNITKCHDCG